MSFALAVQLKVIEWILIGKVEFVVQFSDILVDKPQLRLPYMFFSLCHWFANNYSRRATLPVKATLLLQKVVMNNQIIVTIKFSEKQVNFQKMGSWAKNGKCWKNSSSLNMEAGIITLQVPWHEDTSIWLFEIIIFHLANRVRKFCYKWKIAVKNN